MRSFRSGPVGRRLKYLIRLARDRWTRLRVTTAGGRGSIVCASTWDFPGPTHGFAYQEMLGLGALGLDVRVLFGDARPAHRLAQRFRPLVRSAIRVETLDGIHRRDLARLQRDHPGRIDAFLARVAEASGRSSADLREDPLVLRACTFTRLCELARVRYLQTWFCYDMSFMAMFAAAVLGVPRGLSCHVDHVLDDHPLKLVALQVATADLVLAISRRTERELLQIAGERHSGRVLVKRVGVDATRLRALRGARNTGERLELVSISRIEPKKGLPVLLDACGELRRGGVGFRLRIVGGSDPGVASSAQCAAELRNQVAATGLSGVVELIGPVGGDDVANVLATADVFVAPYVELASGDKDGIPTSMLEAMAAGVTVVCTDAGAITEAVADGVEALVVPQRDALALAAAIARLGSDPGLRARLAAAAAVRFDAEFDAAVVDRDMHVRIRSLLAGS